MTLFSILIPGEPVFAYDLFKFQEAQVPADFPKEALFEESEFGYRTTVCFAGLTEELTPELESRLKNSSLERGSLEVTDVAGKKLFVYGGVVTFNGENIRKGIVKEAEDAFIELLRLKIICGGVCFTSPGDYPEYPNHPPFLDSKTFNYKKLVYAQGHIAYPCDDGMKMGFENRVIPWDKEKLRNNMSIPALPTLVDFSDGLFQYPLKSYYNFAVLNFFDDKIEWTFGGADYPTDKWHYFEWISRLSGRVWGTNPKALNKKQTEIKYCPNSVDLITFESGSFYFQ